MMASHGASGGHAKPSSSTPVKWTLVEAEPETPEGRRTKQQGYGRARAHGGAGGSGSAGNWRSGRDAGRGRGGQGFSGGHRGNRRGGGGGGSGGTRHNQGQGRGRGYAYGGSGGGGGGGGGGAGAGGGGYVGATYYPSPQNFNEPNFEEQRSYMTNLAVRQIEFYFTVENLCRDIFMRSYMDEEVEFLDGHPPRSQHASNRFMHSTHAFHHASIPHAVAVGKPDGSGKSKSVLRVPNDHEKNLLPQGYIPIAFVANFPGVARFGVDLQDISAGILASDMLQVDTENETMRMKEGWEVWLLPNQATGKQGVPRYIKVDPAAVSEDPAAGALDGALEQTSQSTHERSEDTEDGKATTEGAPKVDETNALAPQDDAIPPAKNDPAGTTTASAEAVAEDTTEAGPASEDEALVDGKTELTPTAPAWTPGSDAKANAVEEQPSVSESTPAVGALGKEAECFPSGTDVKCLIAEKMGRTNLGDDVKVPASEHDSEAKKPEAAKVTPELNT